MIESYDGVEPVIHSEAFVHQTATVIGDVEIGLGVCVLPGAVVRGDQSALRIGANTNIQDGAILHSTAGLSVLSIGERVTVGHGAILHGASVGDDCIVGMGSILLDNSVVAPFTIVGAGALVAPGKRFPEGVLLLGNPARVVREITDAEREMIDHSWREYARLCERYRQRAG